ncbi:MAG: glycine--tRNA ligase alpha subunit [Planctomycetota bacterium]|nr:MAG: glycine--tRNA ligase alpha subunit [Planctomycetota bacterium]
MLSLQEIVLRLQQFWARQGCVIVTPYDIEKGAATFHPATCLRCLGPEPWRAAWIEPCRRCKDGRYGENPFRLQHYYQFQVVLKPAPADAQQLYVASLEELGIEVRRHDLRFVHDDWEAPTQGASGLGWEVWLDGMEVTQFTYFQTMASLVCDPVTVEYTYGLERIAMFLQGTDSVFDLVWTGEGASAIRYGDLHHRSEVEFSKYNFEVADLEGLRQRFELYAAECRRCLEAEIVLPAYDYVIKCSHVFNLLDARGAISPAERAALIGRVRAMARRCGQAYLASREALGYPLLREAPALPAGANDRG